MAKEKSIIKILPGNKAIYLEEVFVTFVDQQNPDGNLPISYKALVDSESGKVLATWNRTHIDPMKSREEKILPDLMPSGGI